jgi:hypothetical protein
MLATAFHPTWDGMSAISNAAFGVGDFNGDTTIDIVAASSTGAVTFLLNDGRMNFSQGPTYSTGVMFGGGATRALVVDDFNGDGRADVAIGNSSPTTVGVLIAK